MKRLFIVLTLALSASTLWAQEIDAPDFSNQKTKVIKIDFFSPLTGNTTFKYEQYLKNWMSIEGTVGIIGLGKKTNIDSKGGGLVGIGIKFKKKPDYYVDGIKGSHLMQGGYLKIEGLVSVYSKEQHIDPYYNNYGYGYPGYGQNTPTTKNFTAFAGAIMLVAGKQMVLGDIITVDPYFGIGYGFDNTDGGYQYGFLNGGSEFPVAVSSGLTLGILLK